MAFPNVNEKEPNELIEKVKASIINGKYAEAYEQIIKAMSLYPHSPVPHNLMGILLEVQNRHPEAMSHFRAAYALDATYMPNRINLETYGSMFTKKQPVYGNSDCSDICSERKYDIEYDEKGIGRVVSKKDKKS